MLLKSLSYSVLTALLLLPAVQAEESPAVAAPAAEPSNPMEERIRTYREQIDQRTSDAELLRQQHQAEMEQTRQVREAELEQMREEYQAAMEQTREGREADM